MTGRHAAPPPLWRVFWHAFVGGLLLWSTDELVTYLLAYLESRRAGSARVG